MILNSFSTYGRIPDFDTLFTKDGRITWSGESPLILLLQGSEGSGKSTLALQLSCLGEACIGDGRTEKTNYHRCVLYYVVDDIAERIREKFHTFKLTRRDHIKVTLWQNKVIDISESGTKELSKVTPTDVQSCNTILFLIHYGGEECFDRLSSIIHDDMHQIAHLFDEFTIVIDSVSPLNWPRISSSHKATKSNPDRVGEIYSEFSVPKPAVIILVDEQESGVPRDRYLTDVYIRLWQGDEGDVRKQQYCERYMQIIKAANCPHVRGPQFFRICPGSGIEVLPSLPARIQQFRPSIEDKTESKGRIPEKQQEQQAFGFEELGDNDTIVRGSSTALVGPPVSYKTHLALLFCKKSLEKQGKAVFLALHERPHVARDYARKLGLLKLLEDEYNEFHYAESRAFSLPDVKPCHRFMIRHLSSAFMPPAAFVTMIRRLLETLKDSPERDMRIVIDSISDLHMNYPRLTEVQGFFSVLLNTLYANNVTSLFLFNESSHESTLDKVIVDLADNTFNTHKLTFRGEPYILLRPGQASEHIITAQDLYRLTWDQEKGSLKAENVRSQFYITATNSVEPMEPLMYVSRCTPSLGKFNKMICDIYNVSEENIDEKLVLEPMDYVLEVIKSLRVCQDATIMMAVDTAYLNSKVIEHFTPIDLEEEESETSFVNISSHEGRKNFRRPLEICRDQRENKLRALPVYIDCSLVLCNLEILGQAPKQCKILKRIEEKVRSSLVAKGDVSLDLPTIEINLFLNAAKEFWTEDNLTSKGLNFFGFISGPNPEPLICMFFEWLTANGVTFYSPSTTRRSRKSNDQVKRCEKALMDFVRLYLPQPEVRKPMMENDRDDKDKTVSRSVHNCLFFHTWHSIACSESVPAYCVPIKVGKLWRATRGGWCWGIVNNGLAGPKIREMLRFASGKTMNSYLVNNALALPPRSEFCVETGLLSIYNLGLIKRIIEKQAWSRANLNNYTQLSEYAYRYFREFINQVECLRTASEDNLRIVNTWIKSTLKKFLRNIPPGCNWVWED